MDSIVNMKRGKDDFTQNLHNYVVQSSARGTPELEELQKKSVKHPRGYMTSPPDSIAILQLLTRLTGAKLAIEVGVFTGYTALGMALALPEDGRLIALDIDKTATDIGKPYWEKAGVASRIDLRIGPAKAALEKILKEQGANSADLAFIDADKLNYDIYYELLLKIVRPGGVIVLDNVLWGGAVFNESSQEADTVAIRVLNKKIAADRRVHPAMLKNSDGITIAYKL